MAEIPDIPTDEITNVVTRSITEEEFKKYLPLFVNSDIADQPQKIGYWVWNVAGSPFGEVAVYRKLHNEKFVDYLFTVPPLLSANSSIDRLPPNVNISEVLTQASLKADVMEKLGDDHLQEHLLRHLPSPLPPSLSTAMRWNEIFKRYGLPLIPIGVATAPVEDTSNVTVEYEDF